MYPPPPVTKMDFPDPGMIQGCNNNQVKMTCYCSEVNLTDEQIDDDASAPFRLALRLLLRSNQAFTFVQQLSPVQCMTAKESFLKQN